VVDTGNPRYWDALAGRYDDEVITPFDTRVSFSLPARLQRDLESMPDPEHAVVLDLGVGTGASLALHAEKVGLSIGLDFSPGMLRASAQRIENTGASVSVETQLGARTMVDQVRDPSLRRSGPSTCLVQGDMRSLDRFHGQADRVLAINSITGPESETMLAQACACVAPGGQFWGVFPSRDTMDHLDKLFMINGVERPSGLGDFVDGGHTYRDAEGGLQRFWRPLELENGLRDAGLRDLTLTRVHYPWSMIAESGWGSFPGADELWDWFVIGHR